MPNILFTCAGRRAYLLKYFKEQLKGEGLIVATDMQLSAPALSVADVKEVVPAVYSSNYIDVTIEVCKRNKVDAIISLNDLELPILAKNKDRFTSLGIRLMVSEKEIIDICFDKYRTAQYIESIGLNTPKTFISYELVEEALRKGELAFPLVLKPRWGSGSIGVEFVDSMEELIEMYPLLMKKVKKTILEKASKWNEYILIQEMIKGQEYGLDVMNDLDGNHRAVSVKKKSL